MRMIAAPVSRAAARASARGSAPGSSRRARWSARRRSAARGSQASAMAIITRWRMPPDSWCGYWRDAPLGLGDAAPCPASRPPARSASCCDMPRCSTSASAICWPIGQHRIERGHRLLEDHRDGVAADLAHLLLGQIEQVAAVELDRGRPRCAPAASASRRRIDIAVTLLPQPDSPTMASVSPACDLEADAVDRAHDPVAGVELRLQILDAQQGLGVRSHPYMRRARRGSSASRMPSPSRLTDSTVSDRKMPGKQQDRRARPGSGSSPRP